MKNKLNNILLSLRIFSNLKYNFYIVVALSIIQIFLDIIGIFLLGYLVALILKFDLSNSLLSTVSFIFDSLKNFEIILLITGIFVFKFFINLVTYKKIFSYIKKEQKYLANLFAEKVLFIKNEKKENIKVFTYFSEHLRLCTEYYLVYFLKFISEFIILISIVFLLAYINFKLSLILFCSIGIFIIFFVNFNKKRINTFGKNVSINYEIFLSKVKYFIYSVREIKAFKRDYKFKQDTLKYFNQYSDNRFNQILFSFMPRLFAELFFVLLLLVIFFYLSIYNMYDDNSLAIITLFTLILIRAIPLASACIFSLTNIWNFNYANKIIHDYLKNFNVTLKKNYKFKKINNLDKIQVKNLVFSYNKKILHNDISFEISKNEIFGIFGKSGSGKTTLGLILMGLLKPGGGMINFKDRFDEYNPADLDIFSYIPQEINLMDDTIYRNINFDFDKIANKDKIDKLLKSFNLNKELKNRKNENISSKISGGQKQRILICRALFNKKKVIILDEPSTYLDKKNIEILIKNLTKIKSEVFIILISHDTKLKKICNNYVQL